MKGDFSSLSRKEHYSSVRLQQGRPLIDRDLNLQVDIEAHRDQTATYDVVGPCGTPITDGGFKVELTTHPQAVFFVSNSRGWVVGDDAAILTTPDGGTNWTKQAPPAGSTAHLRGIHFADTNRGWAVGDNATILTTADGGTNWTKQTPPAGSTAHLRGIHFADTNRGWAVGDNATILTTADGGTNWTRQPLPANFSLTISPGRIYVRGLLCELEAEASYLNQPYYPNPDPPGGNGIYLTYLDQWQRHVTAVERPELLEVALSGVDSSTRTETVWQVKLEPVDANATCGDFGEGWTPTSQQSTGQLRARAVPSQQPTNECMIPPGSGFSGLGNQLYRVEIISSDTSITPDFTWSRDNASLLANLVGMDKDERIITVSDPGRDQILGFAGATWVEVSDEERTLAGRRGILFEVDRVEDHALRVKSWPDGVSGSSFGERATVRRWDGRGQVAFGRWLELEAGVQIQFANGTYHSFDYWTIPARSLTGNVEWPQDGAEALFERRHGVEHYYCPLALLQYQGGTWSLKGDQSDCRQFFPSATELTALSIVGGAGQEARPDKEIPSPLQVRVTNGGPVAGAQVRFSRTAGNGKLKIGPNTAPDRVVGTPSADTLIVRTDASGLAEAGWQLGTTTPGQPSPRQEVRAELVFRQALPVWFDANLSIAREVAYSPVMCDAADMGNVQTVEEALDTLCQRPSQGHDSYLVLRHLGGDGQSGRPGSRLSCPLVVGVEDENGLPRPQEPVVFEVIVGGDRLEESGNLANSGPRIGVSTDNLGVARTLWTLGDKRGCHTVRVSLPQPPQERALDLRFEATIHEPDQPETWPTILKTSWENDLPLSLDEFNAGLVVAFSEPMRPATPVPNVFVVILELAEEDPIAGFMGHRPFIVHGIVEHGDGGTEWRFVPRPDIPSDALRRWLGVEREFFESEQIRCRVVLKGNTILDEEGERPLDGEAFGKLREDETVSLRLAGDDVTSGDGVQGGDFESWFWLVL
jgi:hypothetical protein